MTCSNGIIKYKPIVLPNELIDDNNTEIDIPDYILEYWEEGENYWNNHDYMNTTNTENIINEEN